MWEVFNTVSTNVGSQFEYIILFIAFFGGLIWYAKGFQIGLLVNWIIMGGIVVWFIQGGLNYAPAIVLFFIYLVMLAFSFYPMQKAAPGGIT